MLANKALSAAPSAVPVYVEDVFSTYLYTGTGSDQTITNNIDLDNKGGLVWVKNRTNANSNWLMDSERGDFAQRLITDGTQSGFSDTGAYIIPSSTGFTTKGNDNNINGSSYTYASWTFAQQEKFFDVVTYTGQAGSTKTINHNLGSVPGCIIVKSTTRSGDRWFVWHRSISTKSLILNSTAAQDDGAGVFGNGTSVIQPTSTQFTVANNSEVNDTGQTYVAYLFAHDAGGFGASGSDNVITCGSYTGNGSTSGPTVTLNYEPQWIMIKNASTTGSWQIIDNMRGMVVSGDDQRLIANSSSAELSNNYLSPTATGFTLVSDSSEVNGNGNTMIYIAIRRGPMKTPTTGTSVFYPKVHSGSSSYSVGFPTDVCFAADQSGNALNTVVVYRLAGNNKYFGGTASTAAEQTVSVCQFDLQNSFQLSYNNNNQARWHFQRAPGFFDVVCWTGVSGVSKNHNLGVTPDLIIQKRRNSSATWYVWSPKTTGLGKYGSLETNDAFGNTDATATSTTFQVLEDGTGNTFVAYLFASLTGVSKVGTYTGNGSSQTINCGFTAGARFVLIKRYDSTGDWVVFDSARGIVAGDDPYLLLNSTAAEVTNKDAVDTNNSGFVVNETTGPNVNTNSATYIYLAIA